MFYPFSIKNIVCETCNSVTKGLGNKKFLLHCYAIVNIYPIFSFEKLRSDCFRSQKLYCTIFYVDVKIKAERNAAATNSARQERLKESLNAIKLLEPAGVLEKLSAEQAQKTTTASGKNSNAIIQF